MDISGPRVTPSKPDYWNGTPAEGSVFTRQQQIKMKALAGKMAVNQHKYDLPTVYPVKHILDRGGSETFQCPVLSCTRDRKRLQVITPSGMDTWIEWKR